MAVLLGPQLAGPAMRARPVTTKELLENSLLQAGGLQVFGMVAALMPSAPITYVVHPKIA